MKFVVGERVGKLELSLPARGVWIEIERTARLGKEHLVAPRKGSVD